MSDQIYTILAILDMAQIVNSAIGSILVALLVIPAIPFLWKAIKKLLKINWLVKCGEWISNVWGIVLIIAFFLVLMVSIGGHQSGLRVSCGGECSEAEQKKIKRCYLEAKRSGRSARRNWPEIVSLKDFQMCVDVEGFSTVRCKANEAGCFSFSPF